MNHFLWGDFLVTNSEIPDRCVWSGFQNSSILAFQRMYERLILAVTDNKIALFSILDTHHLIKDAPQYLIF